MEIKSNKVNNRKIFFNYFSKEGKDKEPFELKLHNRKIKEGGLKLKDISLINNTRNRPKIKQFSVEKYLQNRTCKNENRNNSTEISHISYIEKGDQAKLNLNFNVNLNLSGTNVNNKNEKEDHRQLSRIISVNNKKNQENNLLNTNLRNYLKNLRRCKDIKIFYNSISKQHNNSQIADNKKQNINMTLTTDHQSKNDSFNATSLNYKNRYIKTDKDIRTIVCNLEEEEDNNFISNEYRQKLDTFKELGKDLYLKNNENINQEMEDFLYSLLISPNKNHRNEENKMNSDTLNIPLETGRRYKNQIENNLYERENKFLKDKIEQLDKKFEGILKENLEFKKLIKHKTEHFNKLNNELHILKKELHFIKSGKFEKLKFNNHLEAKFKSKSKEKTLEATNIIKDGIAQNSKDKITTTPNAKLYFSNSFNNEENINKVQITQNIDKFSMKNKNQLMPIKLQDNSVDLSKMDTLELLSRVSLENPKNVLYFPRKVKFESESKVNNNQIPKLDISTAVHELEEYDLLAQIKSNSEIEIENDNSHQIFPNNSEDKLNNAFMEKDFSLNDSSNIFKSNQKFNIFSHEYIPTIDKCGIEPNNFDVHNLLGNINDSGSTKPSSNKMVSNFSQQNGTNPIKQIFKHGTFDSIDVTSERIDIPR